MNIGNQKELQGEEVEVEICLIFVRLKVEPMILANLLCTMLPKNRGCRTYLYFVILLAQTLLRNILSFCEAYPL